ncbi:MAG: replicative DNA helicase [Lachnospiraceae bacterium]|nr:replicative DNA helicase [Lachnospiraceae bacterium]MCD8124204.1 replicative DNA helicase [Lachnospiraceae bacterium]
MEENLVKRVLPHSVEAEQTVIGAMILDNDAIAVVENIVRGEDFYHRQYGIIYDAMIELYEEGHPVDLLTLQDRLKEKDVPPEVSSLDYIGELVAAVPISANAKYYAEIVYEKSLLRKLIHASEETANACYAGKDKTENILADTEKKIFQVLNQRREGDYVPIQEIALTALERIHKASRTKNPVTGIPTGFTDLDRQLAGLQPSDLILLAARPSMGKTAFALNIAQHACFRKEISTIIFSLEMSKEQLVNRLFAMESRVDAQNIRTGNLTDDDWDSLVEGVNTVGRSKLIIDDTPGITVSEMRTKCRKYKLEFGLQLIIIDYLQLMSGSGRRASDNRQQEISEISRSLKALARELECPVIALSQLSRAVESRADHRPMLSDLRESGAIEQDADVVLFLYRDDYYNKDSPSKNICEVIVAKQRNGPIGTVELVWLPNYTKFVNMKK